MKFALNEPIEDEKKVKQRIRAAVMENVSYVDARIGQRFVPSMGKLGPFAWTCNPSKWEADI